MFNKGENRRLKEQIVVKNKLIEALRKQVENYEGHNNNLKGQVEILTRINTFAKR